jgi:hypothetical protein
VLRFTGENNHVDEPTGQTVIDVPTLLRGDGSTRATDHRE